MHKEILRRVDIHRTGTPPVHITRYLQFIAVLQPVAGYTETSGRGSTGFRCIGPVSYTHLDVYKRQDIRRIGFKDTFIGIVEHKKTDHIIR